MGRRIHDLRELLELLFAMEEAPQEPWALSAVHRGLMHSDPEIREMALSVLGTGCLIVWTPTLLQCEANEKEPWLRRYFALLLDDARRTSAARASHFDLR